MAGRRGAARKVPRRKRPDCGRAVEPRGRGPRLRDTTSSPRSGPRRTSSCSGCPPDPTLVLLTQPDDSAKFEQLVESGDEPGVTAELDDGWWAAAETQEILDEFTTAQEDGDPLADSSAFQDAIDKLPDDALATVYVDADAANAAAGEAQSDAVPFDQQTLAKCLNGGQSTEDGSIAFAVVAEEGGVRLNGVGTGAIPAGDPGAASLDEFFPGDALAFVDAQGFGEPSRSRSTASPSPRPS